MPMVMLQERENQRGVSVADVQTSLDRQRDDAERSAQFVQQQSQMISNLETKNLELMKIERELENKILNLQTQLEQKEAQVKQGQQLHQDDLTEHAKLVAEKLNLQKEHSSLERSEKEFKDKMQREHKQHMADLQEMEQNRLFAVHQKELEVTKREKQLVEREVALKQTSLEIQRRQDELHDALEGAKKVLANHNQMQKTTSSMIPAHPLQGAASFVTNHLSNGGHDEHISRQDTHKIQPLDQDLERDQDLSSSSSSIIAEPNWRDAAMDGIF